MTKEVLLNNGYKEFEVPLTDQYANRFFQKKVKNKKGIKYYIDVYEYELFEKYSYEFNLVCRANSFWVRTTLYAIDNLTLGEIEKEIEKIWGQCKYDYYEKLGDKE